MIKVKYITFQNNWGDYVYFRELEIGKIKYYKESTARDKEYLLLDKDLNDYFFIVKTLNEYYRGSTYGRGNYNKQSYRKLFTNYKLSCKLKEVFSEE